MRGSLERGYREASTRKDLGEGEGAHLEVCVEASIAEGLERQSSSKAGNC